MDKTDIFAKITKVAPDSDGNLYVYGKISDDTLDLTKQRADKVWLSEAVPDWFRYGNVRDQHNPRSAVGKATEHEVRDDGHYVKALIVDPVAKAKAEAGIYTGFSIGILGARVVKSDDAPGGRIVGGTIVEVSLVDRPCNPACTLTLAKAAEAGMDLDPADFDEERMLVKVEEMWEEEPELDIEKRDFTDAERKTHAKSGAAMPDGSFPIVNVQDLKNAIRAIGRAKDPAAAKKHIKARAKALDQTNLIPDDWKAVDVTLEEILEAVKSLGEDDALEVAKAIAKPVGDPPKGDNADEDAPNPSEGGSESPEEEQIEAQTGVEDDEDESAEGDSLGERPAQVVGEAELSGSEKAAEGDVEKAALTPDSLKAILQDENVRSMIADIAKDATRAAAEDFESRLATVEQMAAPGGPARARTNTQQKQVERENALTKAAQFTELAKQSNEPKLAEGYKLIAAQWISKASAFEN